MHLLTPAMEIRGLSSFGIKCAIAIFLMTLPSAVAGLPPPPCIRGLVGCDEYEESDSVREDAIEQTRESTDRFYDDFNSSTSGTLQSYYSRPGKLDDSSSDATPFTWRRRLDGTLERVPLNQRTSLQQRTGFTTFTTRPFERTTSKKISNTSNVQRSVGTSESSGHSSASIVTDTTRRTTSNSSKKSENLSAALLHSSIGESVVQTGCVDIFNINPWHGDDDDIIGAKCFLAGVFDPLQQEDERWWTNDVGKRIQRGTFIVAGATAIFLILILLRRRRRETENFAF